MASGPWAFYAKGIQKLITGGIDLDTDTFKAALVSSSYTPNREVDEFWDDIDGNEVTGTNWAAGGQTLSGVSVTIDTANDLVIFKWSDVSVATVTLTDGKYAVVRKDTGSAATSPLLGLVTFDTALAPTAGTLLIDIDATAGLGRFSY